MSSGRPCIIAYGFRVACLRAAIATLFSRQKPIAVPGLAWWPGGRTSAAPKRAPESMRASTTASAPPAARRAAAKQRSLQSRRDRIARLDALDQAGTGLGPECGAGAERAEKIAGGHVRRVIERRVARREADQRDQQHGGERRLCFIRQPVCRLFCHDLDFRIGLHAILEAVKPLDCRCRTRQALQHGGLAALSARARKRES